MVVNHETPVLVVGGGPAGLIASLQLSRQGVNCMLAERNLDTTIWPKMDTTNARSLELFNRLGISEGIRKVGIPPEYSFDVKFSSGLSEGEEIAKWNDGSQPREPWQRCSQAVFEAWLKPHIQAQPLIKSFFGMKFVGLTETESGVTSELADKSGETHIVTSKYVLACDGAGSSVRKAIGKKLIGGPIPGALYLVHFKSRDLTALHQQGQFCRIYFTSGHVLLAIDEKETWTCHTPVPIGTDVNSIDPYEAVSRVLGGSGSPVPIKIDEIIVTSAWRPNICIADEYTTPNKRVFLSGDSAHQNIPTGAYGMNTAVVDSFDIGWKLAAVLGGYAGPALLDAYEAERRPVAQRAIERSGVHWSVLDTIWDLTMKSEVSILSKDAGDLKEKIRQHVTSHDGENKDRGIELGYRYNDSPVICRDEDGTEEPPYLERSYVPSTWPGARAPQVILKDGETSIFDIFGQGREFSLVDFTLDARYASEFVPVTKEMGIPLKVVHLPDEEHVRKIWERDAVLVRPDDHVAWRVTKDGDPKKINVKNILEVVVGKATAKSNASARAEASADNLQKHGFTGTVGVVDQDKVEMRATFQVVA